MRNIQSNVERSYEYNINGDGDTILFLRVSFVMEKNPDSINEYNKYSIVNESVKFSYRTCRSKFYKYFSNPSEVDDLDPILSNKIQQFTLESMKDEEIDNQQIPLSQKILFKAVRNSIGEHKRSRLSTFRLIDRNDPEFKTDDQGIVGKVQMSYVNTRSKNYKIREHYQISRIRFNIYKKQWEGCQLEGNGEFIIVTLNEKWVKINFPKYWQIFEKKVRKGFKKF